MEKRRTSAFAGTRILIVWLSRPSLSVDKKSGSLSRFQASAAKQMRPVRFCRDNSLPTFRNSLLVPSSRVKIGPVDSVGGVGWMVRVWTPVGQETVFLPHHSRQVLGPTRPSVQCLPGLLSLGKAAGGGGINHPPYLQSRLRMSGAHSCCMTYYGETFTLTVSLSLTFLRITSNMVRLFSWW